MIGRMFQSALQEFVETRKDYIRAAKREQGFGVALASMS